MRFTEEKTYRARIVAQEEDGTFRIVSKAPGDLKLMFLKVENIEGQHKVGSWGVIKSMPNGSWNFVPEM